MSDKKTVLLLGAYGQRNIGDEAMLVQLHTSFKNAGYDIICNSADPEETFKTHGIKSFYTTLKKDFWKKVKSFLTAKVILYGGGSILVDLRMNALGKRALLYRSFVINLFAKLTGKKTIYVGVGVEDVSPGLSQFLLKSAVRLATKCYVRDSISYNILKKYGVTDNVIQASEIMLSDGSNLVREAPKSKKILILPVYRIINYGLYYENYIKTLSEYAKNMAKDGFEVDFFPVQIDPKDNLSDITVLEDIQKETGECAGVNFLTNPNYVPAEFTEFIAKYDIVLSSRFHGLVYAMRENIPNISLTEFQKSESLLKDFDLYDFSLTSKDLSISILQNKTQMILNSYSQISKQILEKRLISSKKSQEMILNIKNTYLNF